MAKSHAKGHTVGVRLSNDLYAKLQICVLEKERTGEPSELSQILREALEAYLERHRRKTSVKHL
jgi:predicted DNA-binding protein